MMTQFVKDYVKKKLLLFIAVWVVSLTFTNCNENAATDNEQEINQYSFYADGRLKSIRVNFVNRRDTFDFTNDGQLENWGKLLRIVPTDSALTNKQFPVIFHAAMFNRVILRLQFSILDSMEYIVWDTIVNRRVFDREAHNFFEAFYIKKQIAIPGEYRYNVLYNYIDSATSKIIYTDSAIKNITLVEKW